MAAAKQYCTFYLDGHYFGIDVLDVQEVFRFQEMTNVPLAPAEISGLINLRGQIITAINLRLRLGIPERPADQEPMNVVVRTGEEIVSLLVDEIGDVMDAEEDRYESAPDTIQESIRELVTGVYKLNDRLLLILDTEKTMEFQVVV